MTLLVETIQLTMLHLMAAFSLASGICWLVVYLWAISRRNR